MGEDGAPEVDIERFEDLYAHRRSLWLIESVRAFFHRFKGLTDS